MVKRRLKCWKKIGYGSEGPAYQRKDTTSRKVIVDTRGSKVKGHKWFVESKRWSATSGASDSIVAHSDSKKEAIRKAKSYMRKHDRC